MLVKQICDKIVSAPLAALQTSGAEGPGFESGISHNDPGALRDHCVIL